MITSSPGVRRHRYGAVAGVFSRRRDYVNGVTMSPTASRVGLSRFTVAGVVATAALTAGRPGVVLVWFA